MITKKQLSVYEYICSYLEENGYPPTVQEIAEKTKCSISSAHGKLQRLEKLGLIEVKPYSSRSIKVIGYKFVKEGERIRENTKEIYGKSEKMHHYKTDAF